MIIRDVEFPDFCPMCSGEMLPPLVHEENVGVRCSRSDLGIWKSWEKRVAADGKFLFFSKESKRGVEMTLDEFQRFLKLQAFK